MEDNGDGNELENVDDGEQRVELMEANGLFLYFKVSSGWLAEYNSVDPNRSIVLKNIWGAGGQVDDCVCVT